MLRLAPWLLLLPACGMLDPKTPEDCEGIGDVIKRDDCYVKVLPDVFRTDPARGVQLVETAVTDPTVKDFIWLEVTRDVDPNSNKYCNRIQDKVLADRCRVLVSRPHLHRDLVDGTGKTPRTPGGPGGAPGGPPGMGGPGGPPAGSPPGGAPSGPEPAPPPAKEAPATGAD